jgi:hypothetical protein
MKGRWAVIVLALIGLLSHFTDAANATTDPLVNFQHFFYKTLTFTVSRSAWMVTFLNFIPPFAIPYHASDESKFFPNSFETQDSIVFKSSGGKLFGILVWARCTHSFPSCR